MPTLYFISASFSNQVVNGVDLEELSEEARDLINSLKGETPLIKVDEVWRELQWSVNAVLDKEMSKSSREVMVIFHSEDVLEIGT